jgi:hypothetical protein
MSLIIIFLFQCMKTPDNVFHESEDLGVGERSFGTNLNHLDEDSDWFFNDQVIIILQNDICVSCSEENTFCGCIKKLNMSIDHIT